MSNKRILSAIVLALAAGAFSANAQTPELNAVELNRRVIELAREGKLDDALPLAKRVADLHRKPGLPLRHLATALENLAQLHISRFVLTARTWSQRSDDGKAAEEILREALEISASDPETLIEQKISIRNTLAGHLNSFRPTVNDAPNYFDQSARDRYAALSRSNYRARSEEARKLFVESITISTEAGDRGIPSLALSLYNQGEFELSQSELEAAAVLYEKSLEAIKKVNGPKSKDLIVPLRSYAKLMAATGQDEKAMNAISDIVRLSKETTKFPNDLVNLTYRSPKAFAIETSAGVDAGSKAARSEAELRGRHAAVLAGNSPEAALATSTLNYEFFQKTNNTRIRPYFVRVQVDPQGSVTEADCFSCDPLNKPKIERIIRDWKFRPFVHNGKNLEMKGYVTVTVITDLLKS